MVITLLLSLLLGLFSDNTPTTTQGTDASASTTITITRPIITDDTGG